MVLITGGTGFLGSYIIKELVEKNHAVRAIRRSSDLPSYIPAEIFDRVEWVNGDILDILSLEDAMEGVDKVIHSAGLISFSGKDRKKMLSVNVEGTANVVNMALEKNIQRFVHISSVAALGRTLHGGHVNEEKKWEESKANTQYARSKFKAELEVWRAISEGLPAVILNPSTILGYGDWNEGSSALFKRVYNEFKWYTSGVNGFVNVEDVAKAAVLAMESDITEERFIINGDNWPFRKLMDTMAEGFGKRKPVKEATPFILGLARNAGKLGSLLTGKKPLLTRESIRVATSKTYFENAKFLKRFPGFAYTPLEQTISQACSKYTADR